jgi:uncharacterized protein YqgC (DUF456 family)
MDIIISIICCVLLLVGLIFCVLPVIPGQVLAFVAILLKYFTMAKDEYSLGFLLIMGALVVVVTILDFVIPSWLVKKGGGTKYGSRGALIGTLIGLIFTPIGMLLGMFLGAFLGELIHDSNDAGKAFKMGLITFAGFFLSTGMKLFYSIACIFFFFYPM